MMTRAKVHKYRRYSEHFAFIGANSAFIFALAGLHFPAAALFEKAAFAVGTLGIYLLHYEEHLP